MLITTYIDIAIYIFRLSYLMITINIIYSYYSSLLLYSNSRYHLPILVIVYPFPLPVTVLNVTSSYLSCSNTQHKVTVTILGRKFTLYYYQMLEALGQAVIEKQPFVFTL